MSSAALQQDPTPPVAAGRELAVGRVISTTFSVWSKHVVLFAVLSVIAMLPMVLGAILGGTALPGITMPAAANPLRPDPPQLGAMGPLLVGGLVTMLLFFVEVGAITHGVIQHLAGKAVSLSGMLNAGLRRVVPLLLVAIGSYLLVVLGMVLLIVPGVFLSCALAVALPAVVAEGLGAGAAIGRSFRLTKSNRLRIFAIFLVLMLATFAVNSVGNFVLPRLTPFAPMVGTVLGLTINLLFGTLIWIAPSVVYQDLRRAKEGTSAAELAQVFE